MKRVRRTGRVILMKVSTCKNIQFELRDFEGGDLTTVPAHLISSRNIASHRASGQN